MCPNPSGWSIEITFEQSQEARRLYEEHGSWKAAERASGINRSTLKRRAERNLDADTPSYEAPILLSPDTPVEEILAAKKKRFARLKAADDSARWMKFRVQTDGPYCLAAVGDPHLDSDGCAIDLVERDLELIRTTDACWGMCLGDVTNNWSGKLQRIYAEQSNTRSEAWALAEWFFSIRKPNDQSIWWLLTRGNHDQWSSTHGNGDPLDWICRGSAIVKDWQAKFIAESPSGHQVRIHACHRFPGNSQWNQLHGPGKAAKFQETADIYIQGDRHNWAVKQEEDQHQSGRTYWTGMARGYKLIDHYADQLGYSSQMYGATLAIVVDPSMTGPAAIHCYADLEEALDYLRFKRRKV